MSSARVADSSSVGVPDQPSPVPSKPDAPQAPPPATGPPGSGENVVAGGRFGANSAKWRELQGRWEELESQPRFFSKLELAEDGGLSEVRKLFTYDRFLWAIVSIAFIAMNLYILSYPNIKVLWVDKGRWVEKGKHHYLIINQILSWWKWELRPTVVVAIMELMLLLVFFLRLLWEIAGTCKRERWRKWHYVATLFWEIIPELMSFSAMRLLYFVTPSIIIPHLTAEITRTMTSTRRYRWLGPLRFAITRIIYAIVGFDVFVVKFREASKDIQAEGEEITWASLLSSLGFLNQMLGVIQVSRFVQWRLFLFIFGGEDGYINHSERLLQKTWQAMLAKNIWSVSRDPVAGFQNSTLWFFAVMLGYGDADFQSLTLNEAGKRRKQMAMQVELGSPS